MTVLVTAASTHGATTEIAFRVSADLAERGVVAEVKKLEEVHDLTQYEAVVVGSAVYMGQWLKPAKIFVEAHAAELAQRPTWLFSSGPIVGDPPTPDPDDGAQGDTLAATIQARGHRVFAGKLDKDKLSWCEKVAVRAARAQEGDFRDWQAIDKWAAEITRELQQTRGSSAASEASDPARDTQSLPLG